MIHRFGKLETVEALRCIAKVAHRNGAPLTGGLAIQIVAVRLYRFFELPKLEQRNAARDQQRSGRACFHRATQHLQACIDESELSEKFGLRHPCISILGYGQQVRIQYRQSAPSPSEVEQVDRVANRVVLRHIPKSEK